MKGIRVGRLELCEARAFVIDAILRANGILLTTLVALAALFPHSFEFDLPLLLARWIVPGGI